MYIWGDFTDNKIKGGEAMTSKELMYVEDALGHEKYFLQKFNETANSLQDAELKSCVAAMADRHQQIFNQLIGLL